MVEFDFRYYEKLINNIVQFLASRLKLVGYWDEFLCRILPMVLTQTRGFPENLQLKIFTDYENPIEQTRIFCYPESVDFNGKTLCLGLRDTNFCILRHYKYKELWLSSQPVSEGTESFFTCLFIGVIGKAAKMEFCGSRNYHNQRRLFSLFVREYLSEEYRNFSLLLKIKSLGTLSSSLLFCVFWNS